MSEPIENPKPIAWFYENDDIKWVTLYKDVMPDDAIPLYTHPVAEDYSLTDEEIMDCWENEVNKWQEIENYDIYNFARAIIKASRGEK
jgi:hypothetical protein